MIHFIYHSKDLDGLTCGALALKYLGSRDQMNLLGYHYGEKIDLKPFRSAEVHMADVSLSPEQMVQIATFSKSFTLYDHHVSKRDELLQYFADNKMEYETNVLGLLTQYSIPKRKFTFWYSDVLAGCEIVFQVLSTPESEEFKNKIRLLGQYDTWRKGEKMQMLDENWDHKVMPFQWGMRDKASPYEVLSGLRFETTPSIIHIGTKILKYQRDINRKIMAKAFTIELNGLRIIACNGAPFNSTSFDGVYSEAFHDAMMPFVYDGHRGIWEFSLYTTKEDIDILSIAKAFGGGGHKMACGFTIKDQATPNVVTGLLINEWFSNLEAQNYFQNPVKDEK